MRETSLSKRIARGPEVVERLFAGVADRLARRGGPQWLSLRTRVTPCDALALFGECEAEDSFYWEEPARGLAIAALGRVHAIETSGDERIEEAARLSRELFADHREVELGDMGPGVEENPQADAAGSTQEHRRQAAPYAGPLLVGGFAFSGAPSRASGDWEAFGPGRLVMPELVYLRRGEQAWISVSCRIARGEDLARARTGLWTRFEETLERVAREAASGLEAGGETGASPACWRRFPSALGLDEAGEPGPEYRVRSDRSHARYCEQVAAAREAIARGELEKVVLARSLEVAHDDVFDLPSFLDTLRRSYPSCATLAVRRARHAFVSASPERLVELAEDRVETVALAGTAPRGRSPEEDERMGRALRESKKEQEEHAIVRHAIEQALRPVCGELAGPETPGLLRVEGIQHLETPLVGRLDPALASPPGVLDLVARLHPTPAVGGAPRAEAQAWIDAREELDRGWYAGPVGFVTARGEGRFRVALRSAHICGGTARLFAGAGIVEASRPEDELRETRLKLRALLAPLTEI
jgi:isochorismate synthase